MQLAEESFTIHVIIIEIFNDISRTVGIYRRRAILDTAHPWNARILLYPRPEIPALNNQSIHL